MTVNPNGSFTYDATHAAVQGLGTGEAVADTFGYTATDANGVSHTSFARVVVRGANDTPIATTDEHLEELHVRANASLLIDFQTLLRNDHDVDVNDEFGGFRPGDRYIDQRFRLPDGSLVGYEYFGGNGPYDQFGNPTYPMVNLVIPGTQYRFVEAREAVALGVVSVAFLLVAAAVVVRRRPG